eukprot:TRINITY_DN61822_c0_g1_i1.p1 TRINITY_DN61822_c0_g1~~TRINITY_DN61822_c0_g1_i1.p1  ORF type:complete len:676 (-),score=121.59 TRINITY_DN61822_c0_g1_i1:116-2143(-)
MGQSNGVLHQVTDRGISEDDSGSEDDLDEIDRLASHDVNKLILEVVTPRQPDGSALQIRGQPVIKNVLTQDWEGASVTPRTVLLHVYDLESFEEANDVLAFTIDEVTLGGAFHAGVEVFGNEWSYGKRGVACDAPRTVDGHIYRCSIPLGQTALPVTEVAAVLLELCQAWRGGEYDILTRNCCSFAAEFCKRLGVGDLFPAWVDRFARVLGNGRAVGEGAVLVGKQVGDMVKEGMGSVVSSVYELVIGGECVQQNGLKDDPVTLSLPGSGAVIKVRGDEVTMVTGSTAAQPRNDAAAPPVYVSRVLGPGDVPGAPPRTAAYPAGSAVEYNSASSGWIPTKVVAFNPALGLYDLECKIQVPPQKIRWPAGAKPPSPPGANRPRFAIGDTVEYNSPSYACWVPGRVLAYWPSTGLYDLDCKAQVPEERIRPALQPAHSPSSPSRVIAGPSHASQASPVLQRRMTLQFDQENTSIGDSGYSGAQASGTGPCSASMATGLLAESRSTQGAGGHLSPQSPVSPAVHMATGLLPPPPASQAFMMQTIDVLSEADAGIQKFPVGADVEYQSSTHNRWVPGKVLAYHAGMDCYDLDCRAEAPAIKIRWPIGVALAVVPEEPRKEPPPAAPAPMSAAPPVIASPVKQEPPPERAGRKTIVVPAMAAPPKQAATLQAVFVRPGDS